MGILTKRESEFELPRMDGKTSVTDIFRANMNVRKSGTPATVVLVKNISEVAPFDRYHRT
jgi:hypothetical protein